MKPARLVFGLYDAPASHCDRPTLARLRDLSLSWARFGYQGPVIEGRDARSVLEQALAGGYEYCLLLAPGTIFDENWYPPHWHHRDLHHAIAELVDASDFLAAGRIVEDTVGHLNIDEHCMLVNLGRYASSGRPAVAGACVIRDGRPEGNSEGHTESVSWVLDGAPERAKATVRVFDSTVSAAIVDLLGQRADAAPVSPYFGPRISEWPHDETPCSLETTAAQRRLLAKVHRQITGARRGVFPLNYESYDDVELSPPGFESPLKAVYCVAAGFKPYRILATHGFDRETRVVHFDYSARALEFRRRLIDEWDGSDYPLQVRRAFREMPPPETYFWLWADLSPDDVDIADLEILWKNETDRWGGPKAFQKHWTDCRSLAHDYVLCNIVENPRPLLERITNQSSSAIWWSNAFFTIYSNWFFTIAERRQRYAAFISGLAQKAPGLFLYGADHMNSSVNSIRAGEYAEDLAREVGDGLTSARFHRLQIRT